MLSVVVVAMREEGQLFVISDYITYAILTRVVCLPCLHIRPFCTQKYRRTDAIIHHDHDNRKGLHKR